MAQASEAHGVGPARMVELAPPPGVVTEQPGEATEVDVGAEDVPPQFEDTLEVSTRPVQQSEVVCHPAGQGVPRGAGEGPGESCRGGHGSERVGRMRGAGNGQQPPPDGRFPEPPCQVFLNAEGPSCR